MKKNIQVTVRRNSYRARRRVLGKGYSRQMAWGWSEAEGEYFDLGFHDEETAQNFHVTLSKELAEKFAVYVLFGKDRDELRQQAYTGRWPREAP